MSSMPARNVAVKPTLEDYIWTQVASGHYSNAGEVVRAGLHLLIVRDRAGALMAALGNARKAQ